MNCVPVLTIQGLSASPVLLAVNSRCLHHKCGKRREGSCHQIQLNSYIILDRDAQTIKLLTVSKRYQWVEGNFKSPLSGYTILLVYRTMWHRLARYLHISTSTAFSGWELFEHWCYLTHVVTQHQWSVKGKLKWINKPKLKHEFPTDDCDKVETAPLQLIWTGMSLEDNYWCSLWFDYSLKEWFLCHCSVAAVVVVNLGFS